MWASDRNGILTLGVHFAGGFAHTKLAPWACLDPYHNKNYQKWLKEARHHVSACNVPRLHRARLRRISVSDRGIGRVARIGFWRDRLCSGVGRAMDAEEGRRSFPGFGLAQFHKCEHGGQTYITMLRERTSKGPKFVSLRQWVSVRHQPSAS